MKTIGYLALAAQYFEMFLNEKVTDNWMFELWQWQEKHSLSVLSRGKEGLIKN